MRADEIKVEVFSNIAGNHVRMTHLPTGKQAECGRHASQLKNREEALRELTQRVEVEPIIAGTILSTSTPINVATLIS